MAGVAVSARERRIAEAGVLLTVLIWSGNFVVVKAAIGVLGPLTFTACRYGVAAATLFLLLRWRQGTIRWPGRLGWQVVGLGMLGFGGYQLLWTVGLTQITAGDSALIIAASPVIVALLAGALGLDRLTPPKFAGAIVAFAGVAIVIGEGHDVRLGASLAGDARDARCRRPVGPLARWPRLASCDGSTRWAPPPGPCSAGSSSCSRLARGSW